MKHKITSTWLLLFISLSFITPGGVFAATRSLSFGMSGADVTALQTKLISQKFLAAGNDNGYFGEMTLAAVKKFQCAQKIACDSSTAGYGNAGPKTLAALASVTAIPVQPSTIAGPMTSPATGAFEISGWVPDWRATAGTQDVTPHLKDLASIMPFGYEVSTDGKLVDHAKIGNEPWPSFIKAAKQKNVRVIPTVLWGDGPSMQAVLSDTTKRIALEDEIANMVKENGFDGVDIDFEAKQADTIHYFSLFLKGLYQRIGNKWVYCAIESRMPLEDRYSPGATIPADATVYANDYAAMNKYCDRIEIMAYDQGTVDVRLNAGRMAPYAPVADPGWVEDVVTLAAQTIPRNKLIVGIPGYGYEYQVTPMGNGGYTYKRLWAFNPKYALDIAAKLGITPTRTSANEIGFTYDPNVLKAVAPTSGDYAGTQQNMPSTSTAQNGGSQVNTAQPFNYITWSDPTAMADKVKLAHRLKVRGVAVFSLGGTEDQAMWDILK